MRNLIFGRLDHEEGRRGADLVLRRPGQLSTRYAGAHPSYRPPVTVNLTVAVELVWSSDDADIEGAGSAVGTDDHVTLIDLVNEAVQRPRTRRNGGLID